MRQQVGAGAGSEATEPRPVDACSGMDQGFVSESNPNGLKARRPVQRRARAGLSDQY
ncbi:hypothetical protein OAN307_c31480 [Octadecabacter antarcticus 307]|uniref:Uncharacterized protein n=1 Tax=Octadecabacter antarcticus 307 TaxID=391626 RepID=M9R8Y9_9RHOB|nr:hypothetical protein OAN307_c31480 [Octadecabacter antarcticus 307]